MPDDGSTQSATQWPLPKFAFQVKVGSSTMRFQEVTGLDIETQAIEFRAGDRSGASPVKMPGLVKHSNVTLKKGIFTGDNKFFDWFRQNQLNAQKREAVTITLLDENQAAVMVWTLNNAFPTKITGTDLKGSGNEVAVESIEFSHEGLTITNQ